MGGLIKAPKPQPLAVAAPTPVVTASADETAEQQRLARLDAIERRRRGISGTIATSFRGILSEGAPAPAATVAARKSLLGE